MPNISVLMKPASGLCNLSCDYCFYCDETRKRTQASYGFMTLDTLKNVIRKTLPRADHAVSYAFQGGEPTLCGLDFFQQAVAYQKQYNHRNIPVTNAFQTNGVLLDADWCRFFHEQKFLVGISVDGLRDTHNACRHTPQGGDTYDQVLRGIDLLDRHRVDYNILTVVNRVTANRIEEIYQDYKRRGWRYQQYILCLDPLDEPRGSGRYSISPEAYGRFLVQLFGLWYRDWQRGCQPYIRQFENLVGLLMGYQPEACDQVGTCGIQYVVEADGSVYPCDFYALDAYRIGNFNDHRIDRIDQNREQIGFVETSRQIPADCRACAWYSLCRCGCRRQRDYAADASVYRLYYCESFKYFFASCADELREMAQLPRMSAP